VWQHSLAQSQNKSGTSISARNSEGQTTKSFRENQKNCPTTKRIAETRTFIFRRVFLTAGLHSVLTLAADEIGRLIPGTGTM
jgi:hypothetical protein